MDPNNSDNNNPTQGVPTFIPQSEVPPSPSESTPQTPTSDPTAVSQPTINNLQPTIGLSSQPEPINPVGAAPEPMPTFTPPSPVNPAPFDQNMVQPSFQSMPVAPSNLTDLSVGQSNEPLPSTPASQPETLVVPSPSSEQPQTVTSNSGGFPKWVLMAGILIILGVAGASAYFILGVGQSKQAAPPILEEQQNPIIQPVNKINPEVVQPSPTTSSASFNNLTGTTISPTKAASGSAIDLLRRLVTPTP